MKELKLSTLDYVLTISHKGLNVGCQTISKRDALKLVNFILDNRKEFDEIKNKYEFNKFYTFGPEKEVMFILVYGRVYGRHFLKGKFDYNGSEDGRFSSISNYIEASGYNYVKEIK